jgi:hypothetical protein
MHQLKYLKIYFKNKVKNRAELTKKMPFFKKRRTGRVGISGRGRI